MKKLIFALHNEIQFIVRLYIYIYIYIRTYKLKLDLILDDEGIESYIIPWSKYPMFRLRALRKSQSGNIKYRFSIYDTRIIIVYFWITSNHANNIRSRWFVAQLTSCDRYIVEERGRFETRRGHKIGVGFLFRDGSGGTWCTGLKEAGGATNRGKRTRDVWRARGQTMTKEIVRNIGTNGKKSFSYSKWKRKKKKKKIDDTFRKTRNKIILIILDIPDSFISG